MSQLQTSGGNTAIGKPFNVQHVTHVGADNIEALLLAAQENPKIIPSLLPGGAEHSGGTDDSEKEQSRNYSLNPTTEQEPTHHHSSTAVTEKPASRPHVPVEQEQSNVNVPEPLPIPRPRARRPLSGITPTTNRDTKINNEGNKPIPPQRTKVKPTLPPRQDLEENNVTQTANEVSSPLQSFTSNEVSVGLKTQAPIQITKLKDSAVDWRIKDTADVANDVDEGVVEKQEDTRMIRVENGEEEKRQPVAKRQVSTEKVAPPPIPPRIDLF